MLQFTLQIDYTLIAPFSEESMCKLAKHEGEACKKLYLHLKKNNWLATRFDGCHTSFIHVIRLPMRIWHIVVHTHHWREHQLSRLHAELAYLWPQIDLQDILLNVWYTYAHNNITTSCVLKYVHEYKTMKHLNCYRE